MNKCSDCGDPPGPGSVVRLVGRDREGNVIELCSRCWIRRERDRAPALPQLKKKA